MADKKVPLRTGWLSEQGLLEKAGNLLGYTLDPSASAGGCYMFRREEKNEDIAVTSGFIRWDDDMMFTVAQLLELGFEAGEFQYCPHCKRLQVDCDAEQRWMAEHNDQG